MRPSINIQCRPTPVIFAGLGALSSGDFVLGDEAGNVLVDETDKSLKPNKVGSDPDLTDEADNTLTDENDNALNPDSTGA